MPILVVHVLSLLRRPPVFTGPLEIEWRLLIIRWLGILLMAPSLSLLQLPTAQLIGAYVVLALAAVYNGSIQWHLPRHPGLFRNGYLTTLGDGLLTVAMIALGGGFATQLYMLLYTVTIASAMRYGYGPSSAVTLTFVAIDFLFLVGSDSVRGPAPEGAFLIRSGFLIFAGILASYLRGQARRAEAALRVELTLARDKDAHARLLTTALEASANAVVLTDRQGRVEWANPAFTTLTGFSLEETQGQSTRILKSGKQPADFYRLMWETVATGRTWHGELVNQRKGGSLYAEEMTITPVHDDEGEIAHFVAIKQDVTDRRAAQVELQAERDFAQQVMTTMGQGLAVTNRDNRYIYVNPALVEMLGCTSADMLGRRLFDLQGGLAGSRLRKQVGRAFEDGSRGLELELRRTDGRRLDVLLTMTPRASGDEFEGGITVVTNLTERKQMEVALSEARDEALEAIRVKSDFLATMSHGIRSPMNGVIGMTALLLDSDLTAQQREYAEAVERCGDSLLELINEILDFSKVEAGRLTLEILDLDVRALLEELVVLVNPQAEAKGLSLSCIVDHRIPRALRGDPGRVRQVLTNLVGNAIKFTKHGLVQVRVQLVDQSAEGALVRFEVTDSGIGISAHDQTRLFEPFTQADSSTTRRFGGTGLGLAICRRLVELMGGGIGIESQPEKGSTFWFTLRLADGLGLIPAPPPGSVPDDSRNQGSLSAQSHACGPSDVEVDVSKPLLSHSGRLLVVEDSRINQRVALGMLKALGFRADAVANGVEALEALERGTYAAVLMDCQMPEMDGYEASREWRRREQLAGSGGHTRIIAMTANAMPGDRERCLESGMDDYISKPVRAQDLSAGLQRWLTAANVANVIVCSG